MLFHKKRIKKQSGIEHERCNHNLYDINTTLQAIPRIKMVNPMKMSFICSECNKIFTLTQDEQKKWR